VRRLRAFPGGEHGVRREVVFVGSEDLEFGSREIRLGRWMYDDVVIPGSDWAVYSWRLEESRESTKAKKFRRERSVRNEEKEASRARLKCNFLSMTVGRGEKRIQQKPSGG
jgi:hypothetical protein